MIADVFKMGTLKGLIFCVLIISVKMMISESAVYTSDTALKFSQCLIEKMSESPFFTLDDRNSMFAVQDAMAQALHAKEHTLTSSKLLLIAFITSLADIILDNDVSSNYYRKETYSSALQQCSISSTGYADAELIVEAQRILSVIESNKPVKYEETGAFSGVGIPVAGSFSSASFSQTSNIGSPIAVQPSPVQNPQAPQHFYPNDRTVFEQQKNPNTPPIASSAQGAFNSKYAIPPSSQIDIASSFGTGMPVQPGNQPQTFNSPSISQTGDYSSSFVSSSQHQNFPVGFGESGISQPQKENLGPHQGKFPNDYDIVSQSETGVSDIPQFDKGFLGPQPGSFPFGYKTGGKSETNIGRLDVLSYAEFPQTSPINTGDISQSSNEGLNIPQTKESSVILIPPKTNQLFISDENLSQNRQQGSEEVVYMPPNQETVAQSEETDFSMTSPAAITPEQGQYLDVTSSLTLESIVFNILTNSPKFKETFNSEISQENAINLARVVTERTFSGYDSNIIKDALSVVTEEVMKVRVPSPETFSFAISNAFVDIVKRHDSSLSADPSQLATIFLSNLDNPRQFHSQQDTVENQPKDYSTDDFTMTSPAAIPQEQEQYLDVTSSLTLESIVFNILTNSTQFRETFNSEISQENAINLARDLTERAFSDYDSNIIKDALSVVTEEVMKVRVPSPETFAFAISNALVDIVKRHDSSLSIDPSQAGTSFLSNLDSTGQFHSQQETLENQPKDYSTDDFSMTSPSALPQEQQQYSDVTSDPTLESIIFNILTNSTKFRKTFNSEISQENAVNLARDLTEHTFSGYDSNIMNDALSAVTEEVLKVRVPSPNTFAFAISNALVYVLEHHDSSLSAEHSQVAISFLSNLDNSGQFHSHEDTVQKQPQDYNTDVTLGQFYPQPETVDKQPQDYDTSESAYYEFDEKQTDFDFQSPPLSPEDRKDEMFSLSLAQYLTKSEAFRNFFCDENKPEDKVQLSFSIIKASLTDYGQRVATLAGSVTSGALSELSKEGLCSNYAKTISEIVAEILEENGIDNVNAEDVAKKMEQNLLQRQITPTESPKPAIILDNIQPRIPKNETYVTEPKLESSFRPIEEINPHHPEKDKYPNLVTSSDSKRAFVSEFTYPVTLLHTSMDLSTVRPNINSERWAPGGAIDKQRFGDYLFQQFHTLDSIFSEESDENKNERCSTTETIESHESGEDLTDESTVDEFRQTGSQKEKTMSTPELDTIAISSDQSEDDKDYNPITIEGVDKLLHHQDESEIPQKDKRHLNSPEGNFKTSRVELQPSFQRPTFESDGTAAKFQKNSGVTSYDSDHTDASVAFARQVSKKTESIIAFIRSQNFNNDNLCARMNQLASLVNIAEFDNCQPIAAMDYLLNVLRAVVRILSGV